MIKPKYKEGMIIVFKEKHGTRMFRADSEELAQKACLKVFLQRYEEGYWYPKIEDLTEPTKPNALTEEELLKLSPNIKAQIKKESETYLKRLDVWERQMELANKVEQAAKTKDAKLAMDIIFSRRHHEYEAVDFDYLEDA